MIISVHMPKTAGMSFQAILEEHFGETFLRDNVYLRDAKSRLTSEYERNLFAIKQSLKNGKYGIRKWDYERTYRRKLISYLFDKREVNVVHGHLMPVKYLLLSARQDIKFVTWLRNPVDRVVSNYYYWKKTYKVGRSHALHSRIVEENWSLEQFCFSPEMRNVYYQYLWGFPKENFDFIGITEFFEEDLNYFSGKYLGGDKLQTTRVNVGESRNGKYDLDPEFRRKLELHHSLDMDLYRYAVEMREKRNAKK
ncbi:MAG: sulfotransferase domain-containing protein [bacterium]|nr:sulfotransferase domain-containing protein [bacterium]